MQWARAGNSQLNLLQLYPFYLNQFLNNSLSPTIILIHLKNEIVNIVKARKKEATIGMYGSI